MPAPKERTTIRAQSERTVLAALRLPGSNYDPRDPFGELAALAEQAGATVVGTMEQRADKPVAGTYMGTGKIKELAALCDELDATMVIFDHELSPRQIGAIEKVVGRKIIDRSELILDIFAGRATTVEAKLQVEMAQLEYTLPRLRAMWSHLERITGGGAGGVGTRGPGEMQLEIDRRLAQTKKLALQKRLEEIQHRRTREVAARNLDHFTVGIVGYTNAGKSTLFNTLTAGGAYADDRVFATLTTRTREWDLTGGLRVMLSDTVGFVRDLPHNLVASFRATLEEATHANALLIVLDVSDPAAELHYDTVNKTLDELFEHVREKDGEAAPTEPPRILLLNKVDRLRDNSRVLVWQQRVKAAIPIVARDANHPGHRELNRIILDLAQGGVQDLLVSVPLSDARTISTIENRGEVAARTYTDDAVTLRVRIGRRQLDQLRSLGARMTIVPAPATAGPAAMPRKRTAKETAQNPKPSTTRRNPI
ncbi:MAG: GTPase HflX [Phycisphaerales bacterium]|nr:GTPase HflX [Phycisphaerales bacterium]